MSVASDPGNPITYVGRVLLISKMRELGLEKLITVANSCNSYRVRLGFKSRSF